MKLLIALLSFLLIWPLAFAQNPGGSAGYEEVKPGATGDNKDVQVENHKDSRGKAKITPKNAQPCGKTDHVDCYCTTNSKVSFSNEAKFTVTGIETGDTVEVSSGGSGTVRAKGGTVDISGSNVSVTVFNESPPGGANVTVKVGTIVTTIPPGSSATVST